MDTYSFLFVGKDVRTKQVRNSYDHGYQQISFIHEATMNTSSCISVYVQRSITHYFRSRSEDRIRVQCDVQMIENSAKS